MALKQRFVDLQLAINVLKSMDEVVAMTPVSQKWDRLPFRIRMPGEGMFFEGDVSEPGTLIDVDDGFVLSCAEVVRQVSDTVERARPGMFL